MIGRRGRLEPSRHHLGNVVAISAALAIARAQIRPEFDRTVEIRFERVAPDAERTGQKFLPPVSNILAQSLEQTLNLGQRRKLLLQSFEAATDLEQMVVAASIGVGSHARPDHVIDLKIVPGRSEEHTSELQ